jgi:hypothetical protein
MSEGGLFHLRLHRLFPEFLCRVDACLPERAHVAALFAVLRVAVAPSITTPVPAPQHPAQHQSSTTSLNTSSQMSATPPSPVVNTSVVSSPMLRTHLRPTTLDAALETHGNDTALPPSTPAIDKEHSPLTPADCRTLKKILDDVHGASPVASPQQQDESLLSLASTENRSSVTGIEDELQYIKPRFSYGDELEAGYEDEDDSMEDDSVYVWNDGDTIEDLMNTPGKTAPPARPQHLDGIYQHDAPTPDEKNEIELQCAALEKALVKERVTKELKDELVIEDETIDLDEDTFHETNDAFYLSDDAEFQAVQEVQAKTGLSMIEEEDGEVELEVIITQRLLYIEINC